MSEISRCVQQKMKLISDDESPDNPTSRKEKLAKAFRSCKNKESEDLISDFAELVRSDLEVPDLLNDEVGEHIRGMASTKATNQPLVPVMSTDVKGIGIFGDDVLVQFHNNKGTYRYHMNNNLEAQQVFTQFVTTGSKGKWLWKNFRGHVAGTASGRMGLSYGGAGKTKPKIMTYGGTNASLEPYDIGFRTPGQKMGGYHAFERMAKELKILKTDPLKTMAGQGVTIPKLESFFTQMTGKPITITPPSVPRVVAKMGEFKTMKQVSQTLKEASARFSLKQLQPSNITKGVV